MDVRLSFSRWRKRKRRGLLIVMRCCSSLQCSCCSMLTARVYPSGLASGVSLSGLFLLFFSPLSSFLSLVELKNLALRCLASPPLVTGPRARRERPTDLASRTRRTDWAPSKLGRCQLGPSPPPVLGKQYATYWKVKGDTCRVGILQLQSQPRRSISSHHAFSFLFFFF